MAFFNSFTSCIVICEQEITELTERNQFSVSSVFSCSILVLYDSLLWVQYFIFADSYTNRQMWPMLRILACATSRSPMMLRRGWRCAIGQWRSSFHVFGRGLFRTSFLRCDPNRGGGPSGCGSHSRGKQLSRSAP